MARVSAAHKLTAGTQNAAQPAFDDPGAEHIKQQDQRPADAHQKLAGGQYHDRFPPLIGGGTCLKAGNPDRDLQGREPGQLRPYQGQGISQHPGRPCRGRSQPSSPPPITPAVTIGNNDTDNRKSVNSSSKATGIKVDIRRSLVNR